MYLCLFIPEVSDSAEQIESPITHRYQRVFAEQNGLGSVGWLGKLGKHNSSHARLEHEQGVNIQ